MGGASFKGSSRSERSPPCLPPGLVVMGLGLAALAGADSESESMAAGIFGYSATVLGAGAVVLGAVIGAAVGGRAAENRPVVVYEGPISQYPPRP